MGFNNGCMGFGCRWGWGWGADLVSSRRLNYPPTTPPPLSQSKPTHLPSPQSSNPATNVSTTTTTPPTTTTTQAWRSFYRWQHLYLPPLYGVLGIKFRLQDVMETYTRYARAWGGVICVYPYMCVYVRVSASDRAQQPPASPPSPPLHSHTNGPVRVNPIPAAQWAEMVFTKLFWAGWRIALPLCHPAFHTTHAAFWPLFLLSEFMTGYFLAFNFQVRFSYHEHR